MGNAFTSLKLKALRATDPDVQVTLNTSLTFPTSADTHVPMLCPDIIKAARSAGSKDNFLEIYKLRHDTSMWGEVFDLFNNIETSTRNFTVSMGDSRINQSQVIVEDDNYRNIDTYLTRIETSQNTILNNVNNCLREAVTTNTDQIDSEKETAEESKLRYESMLAPEERVSYYEGWFPLFRPMSEAALFSLFGVSIFLLLLSIFIFLRMNGIELQLIVPSYGTEFSFAGFMEHKKFYMLGGAAVGAIIAYTGYRRKWF